MDDEALIEVLLYKGEGAALDYKLRQYPFENASDNAKSELLKDILAFVNAWRAETGYILIGVRDCDREVVGLDRNIDDSRLQQFVNSKTNRPIEFGYRTVSYQGKLVGLYAIPIQDRPVYANRHFGLVKADTVYVRRGSSTAEARPDEVARMGAATSEISIAPRLALAIDGWTGDSGNNVILEGHYQSLIIPTRVCVHTNIPVPDFPDYKPNQDYYATSSICTDLFRNMATYLAEKHGRFRLRIEIRNEGDQYADDVKIVVKAPSSPGFRMAAISGLMKQPESRVDHIFFHKASVATQDKPKIISKEEGGFQIVTLHIGKIHTGESLYSEYVYLICPPATLVALELRVHCDQLKSPMMKQIMCKITPAEEYMTIEDIETYCAKSCDK